MKGTKQNVSTRFSVGPPHRFSNESSR